MLQAPVVRERLRNSGTEPSLWYICRPGTPLTQYLHRDGTWHIYCGVANMYTTKEEAVVILESLTTKDILLDIEL